METFRGDIDHVVGLRMGDIASFDAIYEKYSEKLYAFGLKYLRSESDAEELVQSVFFKLWENHKILDPDLSFKSYLFTIAYNDMCKLFRKRKYIKKFIDEALYVNVNTAPDLVSKMDYKSLLERVYIIINKLPEKQRNILMKSREEGKSAKEIAEEVGLSPGTIDNYISNSLKFIRSNLCKEEFTLLLLIFISFI